MTCYQRICSDKKFCASLLSRALNSGEYEDDDFDPLVMELLDSEINDLEQPDICSGCTKTRSEFCTSCMRMGNGNTVDFYSAESRALTDSPSAGEGAK